ncbi:MAG: choline monooxygenase [Myxococcota bacterium]|jgi:choline monooxygenase
MTDALSTLINRFDPTLPLSRASTPPSGWYTDPAIHALERAAVFHKAWHPVAHIAQLPPPGGFLGGCRMDMPWLIVRDTDGALRAFHNTCRHKGAVLVEGAGVAESLVCPFHAWEYRLDGRLKKAPQLGAIADFDRAQMSLPSMGLAQWGPLVLVHADPDAAPPDALFPELSAALSSGGWSDLIHFGQGRYQLDCNWKVFIDNYLDGGYHIDHMHPSLSEQLDMSSYRTEVFAESSIQRSAPSTGSDQVDFSVAARMGGGPVYGWLHPHFAINRYGPGMDTNLVIPLGVDRCEVVFDFYFFPDTDPGLVAASMAQSDVTQQEDITICASVQKGLQSPSYDRGRYAPRWEAGALHFHRLLHSAYTAALNKGHGSC